MNRRVLTLAFVAVVLLAGVQLTGCSRLRPSSGPSGTAKTVDLEFVVGATDPQLATEFRVGDTVRIKDSGSTLGTISSVTTTPTMQSVPTADGKLVVSQVPDQVDIHVVVAGNPVARPDGYRFSGEAVYVNQDLKLVTPLTYCQATVLSIKETGK